MEGQIDGWMDEGIEQKGVEQIGETFPHCSKLFGRLCERKGGLAALYRICGWRTPNSLHSTDNGQRTTVGNEDRGSCKLRVKSKEFRVKSVVSGWMDGWRDS